MELERTKANCSGKCPKDSWCLSQDTMLEILSWLPAKCLASCMCVCRQWRALIQDHGFQMKHASRAAWENMPVSDQAIVEGGATENFVTSNTCLGLLLQLKQGGRKFRVKNPTTRRVLDLPELPEEVKSNITAFFYHKQLQEFKVAFLYKHSNRSSGPSGDIFGAIISLEKDEEWRPLKLLHPIEKDDNQCVFVQCTGLTFHVLSSGGYCSNLFHQVYSYDLESESSYLTVLPKGVFYDQAKVWVCYWEENFAIYEIVGDALQVMVLEDLRKGKWGEKIVIPLTVLKEEQDWNKGLKFWGCNHEFLFFGRGQGEGRRHFTFHPKKGKVQYLRNPENWIGIARSLLSLKGMRPE